MTDPSTRGHESGWRQLTWAVAVTVGALALGYICLTLYFMFQERDQVYWSRLYRSKYDIDAIATATESFHKKYGHYPADLQELTHPSLEGGSGTQFLPRIAADPWGGVFHYEIERGATGERIKIWTVPDAKTQRRLGIAELSNETDWHALLK